MRTLLSVLYCVYYVFCVLYCGKYAQCLHGVHCAYCRGGGDAFIVTCVGVGVGFSMYACACAYA